MHCQEKSPLFLDRIDRINWIMRKCWEAGKLESKQI